MSVVGHRHQVEALQRRLPPVALLAGPPSVGKWTLTQHLATYHGIGMADRFTAPDGLTVDAVRAILAFVATRPFGTYKLITARLDGSTDAALNALLKTLEEPPPTARFLLTASRPTLLTVTSRAQHYGFGLLTVDELVTILTGLGVPRAAAGRAAALGRGQVRAALAVDTGDVPRSAVLAVVRAIAIGDRELFDKAFKAFDDTARDLLTVWLSETITGQFAVYSEADTFGLRRDQAKVRKMLVAVSSLREARSRLGVRAALEPFLT